MSGHKLLGQVAIMIFVLLIALMAFVFWNWDFLQSYVPKIILPADFTTQLMLIFAFMLVLLIVYAVYSGKRPKIGHGPVPSVSMKIREMSVNKPHGRTDMQTKGNGMLMSVTRFHGTVSGSVVFESMLVLLAALLAVLWNWGSVQVLFDPSGPVTNPYVITIILLVAALVLFLVYIFTSKDSKGILAMPVED